MAPASVVGEAAQVGKCAERQDSSVRKEGEALLGILPQEGIWAWETRRNSLVRPGRKGIPEKLP